MLYQQAIQLHKTLNHTNFPHSFEDVTILEQTVCTQCTGRQLRFKNFQNNKRKIGMNMTANKFYCITDKIGLDMLNLTFVHLKKLAKVQFSKFGKRECLWMELLL